jgi:hypothetical protein
MTPGVLCVPLARGLADIRDWIDRTPDACLVVIDTLAAVRPPSKKNENPYDRDYGDLADLQQLAGEKGVAILVHTHQRKREADDQYDTISGTLGLTGAADTSMILARRPEGMTPAAEVTNRARLGVV